MLNKFEELLIESDVGTEIASDLKENLKKKKIGKEIKDEKEIFFISLDNKYPKY